MWLIWFFFVFFFFNNNSKKQGSLSKNLGNGFNMEAKAVRVGDSLDKVYT